MATITLNIESEKAERLARLLEAFADNADAIESLLRTIARLKDTGMLAALEGLAEGFDEGFNYMARSELMATIGNFMMLLYAFSKIDQAILYEIAEKLPKGIETMHKELKKPRHKVGILEMLKILESPDMAAFLKAVQAMISEESYKQ